MKWLPCDLRCMIPALCYPPENLAYQCPAISYMTTCRKILEKWQIGESENNPSDVTAPAPLSIHCHPNEVESTLTPILQVRELRHKASQELAWGRHTLCALCSGDTALLSLLRALKTFSGTECSHALCLECFLSFLVGLAPSHALGVRIIITHQHRVLCQCSV